MAPHTRFALHLFRQSGRWLAPLAVLLLWFAFAVENSPEAFDSLAALFPAFLMIGCWIATSLGDVDDRSHREMVVAAAGSRSRLHRARWFASLAACLAVAVPQVLFLALLREQPGVPTAQVITVNLLILISASALGTSIGSWLQAPLVVGRGTAVIIGFGTAVAVLMLPPVQDALQRLGRAEILPGLVLAAICGATAVLSAWGAGFTIERRP